MTSAAPLTDAELVARLKAREDLGPQKAAAHFGVSEGAFRGSLRIAKSRGLTATTKITDEREKLRTELKLANAEIKRIRQENDSAEKIRETIYGIAARDPNPPEWVARDDGRNSERGSPIMFWSDWHRGELVRKAEVAGVNEFNSDIHDRRVKRLVETTIDLCYNHMGRAKRRYPGAVIMLGGDFINGDIHDELVLNSDRTTQQNINELTDVLAAAIDRMAGRFGRLYLPAVVGNHGRSTLKPRTMGVVHTSHEWNIYCNLARAYKNSKFVKFNISNETDVFFKAFGHRCLLTHGDRLGVKGGDGIIGAIGPIMRGAFKVGRSEATIGRDFDTLFMGHYHYDLAVKGIVVNGGLKGYDNFARNVMRVPYSRASQHLTFVHPDHGLTAHWEVYLQGQPKSAVSRKWVEWAE